MTWELGLDKAFVALLVPDGHTGTDGTASDFAPSEGDGLTWVGVDATVAAALFARGRSEQALIWESCGLPEDAVFSRLFVSHEGEQLTIFFGFTSLSRPEGFGVVPVLISSWSACPACDTKVGEWRQGCE